MASVDWAGDSLAIREEHNMQKKKRCLFILQGFGLGATIKKQFYLNRQRDSMKLALYFIIPHSKNIVYPFMTEDLARYFFVG
jgi:hypothetical protein